MDGDDDAPVGGVFARAGPARFRRHRLVLDPDAWHPFVDDDWAGALVLLRAGEVELFCLRGGHRRFTSGAVLCFDGLGLRALHNPGPGPCVLVGVSRLGA